MIAPRAMVMPKRPRRTLFAAGHIPPKRREVCPPGQHIGPLVGTEKYDAAPDRDTWAGYGECGYCGSTIHGSQIRRVS